MSKYANLPEDMQEEIARNLLEMRLNDTVDERNGKLQLLQHRIDRNAAKARIGINDAYGVFFDLIFICWRTKIMLSIFISWKIAIMLSRLNFFHHGDRLLL